MSHISVRGEQSTSTEIAALANLAALATSGAGQFIRKTGPTTFENATPGSSGSIVVGPVSSTDEAIARFNGTTGAILQNSVVTINDAGAMAGLTSLTMSGNIILGSNYISGDGGNEGITIDSAGNVTFSNGAIAGGMNIYNALGVSSSEIKISVSSQGGVLKSIDAATGDTSLATNGFIEDEKFGVWFVQSAGASAAEFDSAYTRSGRLTAKVTTSSGTGSGRLVIGYNGATASSVNATGLQRHGIPLKPSTKYRLSGWVRYDNLVATTGCINLQEFDSAGTRLVNNTNSSVSGTSGGWVQIVLEVTTNASTVWGVIVGAALAAGDAQEFWLDVNSIMLEEIGTDITTTTVGPVPARLVFTAQTSTDNTDNFADALAAYANTYTVPVAISEAAGDKLTFTPTKKYVTQIGLYVVTKGTGDWKVTLHDASNNPLRELLIANASVTAGAWNYFDVPTVWLAGALHAHVTSTVADGTVKTNTSADFSTASYIQRYGKKTEGYSAVINGVRTRLMADEDGMLHGSVIDLDNGKYIWESPIYQNDSVATDDIIAFTDVHSSGGSLIPNFGVSKPQNKRSYTLNAVNTFYPASSTFGKVIFKVNTILPAKRMDIIAYSGRSGLTYSFDNITYTTLTPYDGGHDQARKVSIEMNGRNIVYIKLESSGVGASSQSYGNIELIQADLDVSSLPIGKVYPINAVNQFTETIRIPRIANRVYFRLNKFSNEYGIPMPALEFMSSTGGVSYGYIPLKIDHSQETATKAVNIILAQTTNAQQSGTGSADGLTGYILNDAEYMTFTSAVSDITLAYKVGTGTTSFSNITLNAYYLSSNSENNSSSQDPSHKMNVSLGARNQGAIYTLSDSLKLQNDAKQYPLHINDVTIASGTDYTLTTSLAVVSFGTSGNVELKLPDKGIYEVTADIHEDFSGVTASASANYSLYQLYRDGLAVATTERTGMGISILAGAVTGYNAGTLSMKWIITSYRAGTLVSLYGKKNSATTGNWLVKSDATGRTRFSYRRIA